MATDAKWGDIQFFAANGTTIIYAYLIIVLIAVIVQAYYRLSGPGISRDTFSILFKRYIASSLLYMICYSQFLFAGLDRKEHPIYKEFSSGWYDAQMIVFCFYGYFLLILRASEPAFKNYIFSYFS